MTQRNSLAAPALAAFGIVLLGLSAWAFAQEGKTYLLHANTAVTSIALRSPADPTGLGVATRNEVLRACERTLRSEKSFELMVLSSIKFEDLAQKCADIAEGIAADAPTFSFAWAIAARAAAVAGDWPKMNQYLKASQQTAPNQQWIGRLRFEIADIHYEHLNEASRPLYDQDLAMLIKSNKGIPYIARQYVGDVGFRSRITAVLQDMSEADQRRYISTLRRMLPR
ncbi:hypothetical protein [Devosia submarina]|uniref:hypothetical protein n=1 Tax=Devosia submarina TaxID=1173082 RepID=UPI000D39DFAC|nr:hypothetical protein [Devosia submarina]